LSELDLTVGTLNSGNIGIGMGIIGGWDGEGGSEVGQHNCCDKERCEFHPEFGLS
jgi:hypothetical protein